MRFVKSLFKKRAERKALEDELLHVTDALERNEADDRCRILHRKNALIDCMFEWFTNDQRLGWGLLLSPGGHFASPADFHISSQSEARFGKGMVAKLEKNCISNEKEGMRIGKLFLEEEINTKYAFYVGDEIGSGQVHVVLKVNGAVRTVPGFVRQNLDRVALDPAVQRTIERSRGVTFERTRRGSLMGSQRMGTLYPEGTIATHQRELERVSVLNVTIDNLGPVREGIILDPFQRVSGILNGDSSGPGRYAAHKPNGILEMLRRYRYHLQTQEA